MPDRFIGKSIGGQRVLLLVRVSGEPGDGAVTLRAEAAGAGGAAVEVEPAQLDPGTIGEVLVVPAAISGEADLTVTVTASRDGQEQRIERTVPIVEGSDGDAQIARAYLDRFIPWLATTHPELGISEGTVWQGTPGSWVLIVTHYVFISADWEVDLAWHVMTPPNDWIRIQLRHRWTETAPSVAFEIPSAAGTASAGREARWTTPGVATRRSTTAPGPSSGIEAAAAAAASSSASRSSRFENA